MKLKRSKALRIISLLGLLLAGFFLYLVISVGRGGHMAGPTYIAPGNVGLVIDNYQGNIEKDQMQAGLHWQGVWETVIEVPTAQRTISLDRGTQKANGDTGAVAVNTASNMLMADVSAQYNIRGDMADDLYASYQDQFSDTDRFEQIHLVPAIKEAINYAIGDIDTADALTAAGKEKAAVAALLKLQQEWGPRGVDFHTLLIRGIDLDQESKDLLNQTVQKLQEIDNTRLALKQQEIDNKTLVQRAQAEARVNHLQDASLTDLYVQDKLLERVKTLYLPSDEIIGLFKEGKR